MGARSGSRALVWALAALLLVWPSGKGKAAHPTPWSTWPVTFTPSITVYPAVNSRAPAHNGRVCSTWGNFHYKTFDGAVFRFPGLCNYVFSAHCGAAYEDFNIQLRRGLVASQPAVTRVVLKAQGLVLELSNGSVLLGGQREDLPLSRAGLLVERNSHYVKVSLRGILTFVWNEDDSALLELDPKYVNQTCGLCGDFNGLPAAGEFYGHYARLSPLQFGNLQKLDGPTEQCQDPLPSPAANCTDEEDVCHRTLLGPAFAECHMLVDVDAYVAACVQDLCRCPSCPCATFAEYSRQCTHAGGRPQNWRRPDLCPRTCPLNTQPQECGSACASTCSNPQHAQLCEDHCTDGCFCPPGTVLDDITHSGCLRLEQCPCTHGGRSFAPGASFSTSCSSCTCAGGMWQCQDVPCPGTCTVRGGSHISTYDEKLYDLHGDCSYVLSKQCADHTFTVLAELRRCGLTDSESCLKAVTLSLPSTDTVIRIQAGGSVFVNSIYTQLPVSAANITVFSPSSFFIVVHTSLGLQLQVQLVPLMQVFLRLDPAHRGQMCGLCGNFNQNQADDFAALSGVVEGTGAAFANTWKTQATCPDAKNSIEDPCSLSVENENYAQYWCSRLTDPAGAFASCHSTVNPTSFHSNCLFDTCNCEKSEECMCAALASYVHACAAKGVLLRDWRDGVCTKYMSGCPKSQNYSYVVDSCQPTCRARSEPDLTCAISFVPVDGCTCPQGTFLNDVGTCVAAQECPCYFLGLVMAPGEVVHDQGTVCSCSGGKLSCLGASLLRTGNGTGCAAPMVYVDCSDTPAGTPGAECLRSCHTLDVDCFSTHCVSGCVCPTGLVSDGSGGCVAEEDCPCLHNEAAYQPGQTIRVGCNTCTCRKRRWECSQRPCLGTCVSYGDGHFITFDGQRYSFEGNCEYTLAQDYCGGNGTADGSFRILTENVPCGTTGTTCSKAIKLFLEGTELLLEEGAVKVAESAPARDLTYRVRHMGLFLVIETRHGVVVAWDRKTSVFIWLSQDYKGRVCGLCGNFDDNAINDFTTRSQSVVGDALEFGNSWKSSPSCPDAQAPEDACTANPYRKSWAQRQCSILNSATFAACHSQVDSAKYYEACVQDACACDSGGDCECFCTAVAAYAQACREAGVCVSWRSPDVCPLFCEYYDSHGECQWHYDPCGAPCLRTCRNPEGQCLVDLPGLEGCYPRCPPDEPFFSEDQMKCVAQCGCYDQDGHYYDIGARVPTTENCQTCNCTPGGLQCTHSLAACSCNYEGKAYGYGGVIYNTTDGLGACLIAVCGENGTISRRTEECPGVSTTAPFTFTTTAVPPPTTEPTTSTTCNREVCSWSPWYDGGRPEPGMAGGDFETFANLRHRGYQLCWSPVDIECRAQQLPDIPLEELGQRVDCDLSRGLTCFNGEQSPPLCHNYELRVLCCQPTPCEPTTGITSQPRVTQCKPRCQWTEWLDVDYPTSEETGGDMETYENMRAAGLAICAQPQDIQCEAENYPGQSLEQLGQKVHCDVRVGLVCRNQEQPGLFSMCYNYRVRVLCCEVSHCGSSLSTPSITIPTTTKPKTSAWMLKTSLGSSTPATASHRVTQCKPRCQWTEWLDVDYPTSEETGGDMETYENMRAAGLAICAQPQDIQCEAENYPGQSLEQLGQKVHCDVRVGLVCRNQEQPGLFSMCYNYRVRVLCCEVSHCGSSLSTPSITIPTTTKVPSTQKNRWSPTAATTTRGSQTTSHVLTSTEQPSTLQPKTSAWMLKTSLGSSTPATASHRVTQCKPRCQWTEWLDVDYPTSEETGGDMETYENMRAAGLAICAQPQDIQCEAENYPGQSLEQLGQKVHCDVRVGLVCRNQEQPGLFRMCYNYRVRVLCCEVSHCGSSLSTSSITIPTTTKVPSTQKNRWSPTAATTTRGSQTTSHVLTSTQPRSTFRTWTTQTSPGSSLTTSHVTTTGTEQPSTTQPETTSTWTTQTSPGITVPDASSPCQPRCQWTEWFDVDFPASGVAGGDMETYENIRAAGGKMCPAPKQIECRAENYPEVSIDQIGQVVTCSLEVGLVCRNTEQQGGFAMCFNYNVRMLCCDDYSHCHPPSASTTTLYPSTGSAMPGTSSTTATSSPPTAMLGTHSTHTPKTPHTHAVLSTRAVTSVATHYSPHSSTAEMVHRSPTVTVPPSSEQTTVTTTPMTTRSTGPPSSTVGTIPPSSTLTTMATSPTSTRSTGPPSSTVGTIHPSSEQTTVTTTPMTTSSMATRSTGPPSSTVGTIPPSSTLTTTATSSLATSSMATRSTGPPSSTVGTIPPSSTLTTMATSPTSTRSTGPPSSTVGTIHPSSEQTTVTTTPMTTSSMATRSTGPPSSTVGTIPPSSTLTTTATSSLATSSMATRSTGPPSSTVGTIPPSSTLTTTATSSMATRSIGPPSSTVGTIPPSSTLTTTATSSLATSSMATRSTGPPSSTVGTIPPSSTLTTMATSPTSTSSTGPPSSTVGTIHPSSEQTTVTTTPMTTSSMATRSTGPPSSTVGTIPPSSTLTTMATSPTSTRSTGPPSSTVGTIHPSSEQTTVTTTPMTTSSMATRSTGPPSSTVGTIPPSSTLTTTATSPTATRSTGPPFSTAVTLPPASAPTTTATSPMTTGSTEPMSSTAVTTSPLSLPTSTATTSSAFTASSPQSSSSSSPLIPSMSPIVSTSLPLTCMCQARGQVFSPGAVIYNETDGAGCHFYAICGPHCELRRFQDNCSSPAPPVSLPTTPPTPPPPEPPGCDNAIPPRQVNESWTLENCTVARCEGNNRVVLLAQKPVANITCANGQLPVTVSDPSEPCKFHYECECSCSAWGNSHFLTFDGTAYSFSGNCTYVLMREIHPGPGDLSLYLNNHYCRATMVPHCARALMLHFKAMDIVLTTTTSPSGRERSLILVDNQRVSSGFLKDGVSVSVAAASTMRVDIPALGVSVTFDGQLFQAQLPFSRFSHNTEGLCGTCTNNQRDDCRQPDGTTASSCQDMAKTWLVNDNSTEGCSAPTSAPPTSTSPQSSATSTPASTPCPPSPLCKLLLGSIFAECHSFVPPGPFFTACVSDSCLSGSHPGLACQSLEAYAGLCRARGICSDWRNSTSGLCDLPCPHSKVYRPCGPVQPASCDSRSQSAVDEELTEGCFCPEGQILFNTHTGVCVSQCPCVGPDGFPKFPGEQWISGCQSCVCDANSVSVHCQPVQCEAQDGAGQCSGAGFVPVTRSRADNPCCLEQLCVCNTTTCPQSPPECGPAQELTRTQGDADCCPTFSCRPKLCSYNGTVYGVGATFPGVIPCHTCTCLVEDTQDPTVRCEEDACSTSCPQGFEYSRVSGQCCGQCVQTACLTPEGRLVQPNETWTDGRVDNCTRYRCEAGHGSPVLTPQPVACPDVSSCRGTLRKTGCCYSCEEGDPCLVRANTTVLQHGDCVAEEPVSLTFCEGACPGSVSRYSMEAQTMQHSCSCCKETSTHEEVVTLRCPDGTTIQRVYTQVDECACSLSCLPPPTAPTLS
ncbi:mucin-5B [Ochotona curzoniae]|uniref:mucin-5B n=1 Tax=Ochotona curzoniae TaxID=130825 RepID=UPI001B346726|nr:mucin-5B [Ochotona curzoniae]